MIERTGANVNSPLLSTDLSSQQFSNGFKLPGTAQLLVLVGDELCVFSHENFTGGAQVEILGFLVEELAVNPGPDQASICINIDLGNTQGGGFRKLICIDTLGAFQVPATGVYPLYLFLGN